MLNSDFVHAREDPGTKVLTCFPVPEFKRVSASWINDITHMNLSGGVEWNIKNIKMAKMCVTELLAFSGFTT